MGKEKKIGLAVISILLSVFVALLCKRLRAIDFQPPTATRTPALAEASVGFASAANRPVVVTAERQIATVPASSEPPPAHWNASGRATEKPAISVPEEPRQSFLPVRAEPAAAAAPEGNEETEPATTAADPGYSEAAQDPGEQASSLGDPFRRRVSSPLQSASDEQAVPPSLPPLAPAAAKPLAPAADADEPNAMAAAIPSRPGPIEQASVTEGETQSPQPNDRFSPRPLPVAQAGSAYPPLESQPATPPSSYALRPTEDSAPPATYASAPTQQQAIRRHGDQYVVQPNDSYWKISERVYGSGGYFKAIFEHNRKTHPQADRLQVGEILSVPDAAVLEQKYPDLTPKPRKQNLPGAQRISTVSQRRQPAGRVYVVEEGDTLFDIARYELGKASRWGEIYELNREVLGNDYDYLRPGLELVLPTDERSDPITERPTTTFQR